MLNCTSNLLGIEKEKKKSNTNNNSKHFVKHNLKTISQVTYPIVVDSFLFLEREWKESRFTQYKLICIQE